MNGEKIVLVLGAFVAIRIVCHFVDKDRIRSLIESAGGKPLQISWKPFAKGWFGEKGERHYEVSYQTPDGLIARTTCKTSLFTGIYWAGDTLPHLAQNIRQAASDVPCRKCGYALQSGWKVCPNCGEQR